MEKILKRFLMLIVFVLVQRTCEAQVFNLGNTSAAAGWYKLGRLYLPQQGHNAQLQILFGTGYNAAIDQIGESVIYFRTSNASSQINGFYGAGTYSNTGRAKLVNSVRVVQITADTWDFYANLPTFTGDGGTLILQSVSGKWTPGFTQSTPPSTAIFSDLIEESFQNSNTYFSGNVGIGTATPREKLSVNGNIRAKEVKVETKDWPDYVFKKDYKMISLPELKEFIRINEHLPEMPKAEDAEINGVELGQLNKLLLKKVEELTLLLINQYENAEIQSEKLKQLSLEMKALKETIRK